MNHPENEPLDFLRLVGRTIRQAVSDHEQRLHGRGEKVVDFPPALVDRRPRSSGGSPGEMVSFPPLERPSSVAQEDLLAIRLAADRVLRECSCSRPPVPINVVAMFAPGTLVQILEADLGHERGECLQSGNLWRIRVSGGYGPRVQRFIIAREAFQILLATGSVQLETRLESGVEWLADRFASYLLMPEPWVRETWQRVKRNRLQILAGIFEVSQPAMRIRLRELELQP